MSEARILVSTDALGGLVGRLQMVAHALREAASATGDGHTGDGGLEQELQDFHSSWSGKRGQLAQDIEKAGHSLENSLQTFTEADGALARAVNGPPP